MKSILKMAIILVLVTPLTEAAGKKKTAANSKPHQAITEGIQDDQSIEVYTLRGDGDQAYRGEHENQKLKVYRSSKRGGKQLITSCGMSKNSLRALVGSGRTFDCGSLKYLVVE